MGTTGFEEGLRQGERRVVQAQLDRRFGPLPPEIRIRLESLSLEELDEVSLQLLDAKSLDDLELGADQSA
jgi:hypothetical protein